MTELHTNKVLPSCSFWKLKEVCKLDFAFERFVIHNNSNRIAGVSGQLVSIRKTLSKIVPSGERGCGAQW